MSPSGAIDKRRTIEPRKPPRRGVTLVELLIVITIIAILVSLLFPAIMAVRKASMRTSCDNNIRQIDLGVRYYMDAMRGFFPLPPTEDRPSGWAIAILPYTEEGPLALQFDYTQPRTSPHNLQVAGNLPSLYVCPVVPHVDSTLEGVGVCNYVVVVDDKFRDRRMHRPWRVKEAAEGSRFPWLFSTEILPENAGYPPPHESAYKLFGLD